MRFQTCDKCIYVFAILFCLPTGLLLGQTPPDPTADRAWTNWWYDNSVSDVENEFNAARRNEETLLGLPNNILGTLNLPADFLSRDSKEQALILINEERAARHGVNYGNGAVSGLKLEGVELDLSNVAQDHADEMRDHDFFSHYSLDGTSPSTRIRNQFPNCEEGLGENIAWNSVSGGFILGVPLAIYGFIYDDSGWSWGHRHLCLGQSGNNNYGDPSKLGLVGFGRAVGNSGDYFVMDYIDPMPSCQYNVTNFDEGGGSCPEHVDVAGMIMTGTYQADQTLASNGMIPDGETVNFRANSSISLDDGFEVQSGAQLEASIEICSPPARTISHSPSRLVLNNKPQFRMAKPVKKIID